jgi:hypothetical protein
MENTYHEIFIPFSDVYMLGGNDVFENLERQVTKDKKSSDNKNTKNLVIFPSNFAEVLDPTNKKFKYQNTGGGDEVLQYLKNIKSKRLTNEEASSYVTNEFKKKFQEGIAVYNALEGLDIAYIDYPIFMSGKDKDITTLENEVRQIWKSNKNVPCLLTINPGDHIKYNSRGKRIEDPKFLLVNEDIVNEGIIIGNYDLLGKLYESKNNSLPLEQAIDILGVDSLYINQFIKFIQKDKNNRVTYVYAKVNADLTRNNEKHRIVEIDNIVVSLLDREVYNKNKAKRHGTVFGFAVWFV